MKQLRAKLYEIEWRKRQEKAQALEDSQGRHRLGQPDPVLRARPVAHQGSAHGVENSNTTAVLDGDIDAFLEASLKEGV
jgi:peptide chain release factor 2